MAAEVLFGLGQGRECSGWVRVGSVKEGRRLRGGRVDAWNASPAFKEFPPYAAALDADQSLFGQGRVVRR